MPGCCPVVAAASAIHAASAIQPIRSSSKSSSDV